MANSDVQAALATLDTAIQALDTSALEAAAFTPGKVTSYAHGVKWELATTVANLKLKSAEAVDQIGRLDRIGTGTPAHDAVVTPDERGEG